MTYPPDRSAPELPPLSTANGAPASIVGRLTLLRQDQRLRWKRGERPRVEDYLERHPALRADADAVLDLVYAEFVLREEMGEAPAAEEYLARFPEQADALRRQLDLHRALASGSLSLATTSTGAPPPEAATLAPSAPAGSSEAPTLAPSAAAASEACTLPPMPAHDVVAPETWVPDAGDRLEAPKPAPVGVTVPGYVVLGTLGKGGMGVVYKARQVALNRAVALKMILHAEHAGEDERRRFRAEAEAVASLQHPNIVQIYEVGEHGGLPYFSLEFCGGGSLEKQLDGTPWEGKRAARLVETLARAMQAAHQKGLIHRDLKPQNVLLAEDGTPKITDFGLAKKLDTQGATQTGAVVGTPSYMAPEQAGGRKDIGPAADVYALGAILYELLTGRPPFRAATALDTVLQVLGDEPVPVRRLQPKVPKDLETICLKCLEKEPRKRYVDAEGLAEDLRRFGGGEPVAARPVSVVGRVVKWAKRRPMVAAMLAGIVLVSAAGLGGILWAYGEAVRERTAALVQEGRADRQAKRAEEAAENARREAEAAKEASTKAERQTYFAQIGRADAQLLAGDHPAGEQVLFRVSKEYRGWEYGYLHRRAEGTPLTLRGHSQPVTAVSYSPDGKLLASAAGHWNKPGEVKVWNTRTGTEILSLQGHMQAVTAVSFSPDGTRLASASDDSTVKVWDAHSGADVLTLRGHTMGVKAVTYSPDGTRIASGSDDGAVKVWNARSGAAILTVAGGPSGVPGHTTAVLSVSYSPDGTRLASASSDQTVKVWDARSGVEVLTLRGHTGGVTAVSYSPEGSRLASASWDNTVKVWDACTGALLLTLRGHTGGVSAVSFSPDGTRIASAPGFKFIGDSELVLVAGEVRVWDAQSGVQILTLRGHMRGVNAITYSPDGTRIASASFDKTVKVWNTRNDTQALSLSKHSTTVQSLRFSPDGTYLASASGNPFRGRGEMKVRDVRSGADVLTLRGSTYGVNSVSYSPDGARIAATSWDNMVNIWDARSGANLLTLDGGLTGGAVSYSPDGTRIATSASDNTIKVWDAGSGADLLTLRGHQSAVVALSYSPDGTRLASASYDGTVKVWDARSGADVLSLRGHTGPVAAVSFSPDGRRLASASFDKTVKVWDAQTGAEVLTLRGHTGIVNAVSYSPDGSRLASASSDNTVKEWDAHSGAEVLTLRGHTGGVSAVSFSPDGTRIASASGLGSASATGEVMVWDARTAESLPHYDPWAEAEAQYQALAPSWHAEEAAAAEKTGDAFAAIFHRRWLVRLRPNEPLERVRLARALARFGLLRDALDIVDRLLADQPILAPAYLERARLRLAAGQKAAADTDTLLGLALASRSRPGWPDFAVLNIEAATAAAVRNDWPEAREQFRLAVLWQTPEPEVLRQLAWVELAAGDIPTCRLTLRRLYQEHRGAAATPANTAGLAVADTLVRHEAQRAAIVARAACLLPDAVEPAELVSLARKAAEARPQNWERREVLGAALYRAGKVEEAIRELNQAVRLHGTGSLWSNLFLALAHQQLAQAEKVQQLRQILPVGWEEHVIKQQLLRELGAPRSPPAK